MKKPKLIIFILTAFILFTFAVSAEAEDQKTYKQWDPGTPIKLAAPDKITAQAGKSFSVDVDVTDIDHYTVYEMDEEDLSRMPKEIDGGTEEDGYSLLGTFEGKTSGRLTFTAPKEPGEYTLTIKVDDDAIVRLSERGSRDDKAITVEVKVIVGGVKFSLTAKDTQADSQRIGNPLNMVKKSYNRESTIITKLSKGKFPEDYPQWSGEGVKAEDGDKEASWSGSESVVVTAKAYDTTETADIILRDEDEPSDIIMLNDQLTKIKNSLGIWINLIELATGKITSEGSYLLKKRLVDVYNSPDVDYNVRINGDGSVSAGAEAIWELTPEIFTIPLKYKVKVKGDNMKIKLTAANYMKDLTVSDKFKYGGSILCSGGPGLTATASTTYDINKLGIKQIYASTNAYIKISAHSDFVATTGDLNIGFNLADTAIGCSYKVLWLDGTESPNASINLPLPVIKKALSYDFTVNFKDALN